MFYYRQCSKCSTTYLLLTLKSLASIIFVNMSSNNNKQKEKEDSVGKINVPAFLLFVLFKSQHIVSKVINQEFNFPFPTTLLFRLIFSIESTSCLQITHCRHVFCTGTFLVQRCQPYCYLLHQKYITVRCSEEIIGKASFIYRLFIRNRACDRWSTLMWHLRNHKFRSQASSHPLQFCLKQKQTWLS